MALQSSRVLLDTPILAGLPLYKQDTTALEWCYGTSTQFIHQYRGTKVPSYCKRYVVPRYHSRAVVYCGKPARMGVSSRTRLLWSAESGSCCPFLSCYPPQH